MSKQDITQREVQVPEKKEKKDKTKKEKKDKKEKAEKVDDAPVEPSEAPKETKEERRARKEAKKAAKSASIVVPSADTNDAGPSTSRTPLTATKSEVEIDNALGGFSSQVTETDEQVGDVSKKGKKEKKDKGTSGEVVDASEVVDEDAERKRRKKEKKEKRKAEEAAAANTGLVEASTSNAEAGTAIGKDNETKRSKKDKKDKKRKREDEPAVDPTTAEAPDAATPATDAKVESGRNKKKKTKLEKVLEQEQRDRDAVASAPTKPEAIGDEAMSEVEGPAEVLEGAYGDASLSDTAKKALAYCEEYAESHKKEGSKWKFQKAKQIWLVRHLWDDAEVPDKYVDVVIGYLKTVQGGGRAGLIDAAKKRRDATLPSETIPTAPIETAEPAATESGGQAEAEIATEAIEVKEESAEDIAAKEEADRKVTVAKERAVKLLKAMGAR